MIGSLQEIVGIAARHVPAELASTEALASVVTVAGWLPDAITQDFGFECRLGGEERRVDLILLVTPSGGGRDILAGAHPTIELPGALLSHPAWSPVRSFCAEWGDTASRLSRRVHGVWLEFDVERRTAEIPIPGLFFHVNDIVSEKAAPQPLESTWITDIAKPFLCGVPFSAGLERSLGRAVEFARGRATVLQVGFFPSRELNAIRLFLHPHSREKLLDYLSALGSCGAIPEVDALAAPLYALADHVFLDVDVGDDVIYPRIGLECLFEGFPQPSREPRWFELLRHLVDRGLCTPGKMNALVRFPGSSIERVLYERVLHRGLHHLKVIHQPGVPPAAKAYIGCKHRPAIAVSR